jgi:hypothetical protein
MLLDPSWSKGPPESPSSRVVLAAGDLAILNFYLTLGSEGIQRLD